MVGRYSLQATVVFQLGVSLRLRATSDATLDPTFTISM
jgi:hypothetical protein